MTEAPARRMLRLSVLRYNPREPGSVPRMQAYELEEARPWPLLRDA